jgi:hypothetical protein
VVDSRTARVFVVTLRAAPNVDGLQALRALLRTALRRYGLRCTRLEIVLGDDPPLLEKGAQERIATKLTHSRVDGQ